MSLENKIMNGRMLSVIVGVGNAAIGSFKLAEGFNKIINYNNKLDQLRTIFYSKASELNPETIPKIEQTIYESIDGGELYSGMIKVGFAGFLFGLSYMCIAGLRLHRP